MTAAMNLISVPARELTPASRRSGEEAGRHSAEASPQRAFEQALDKARELPKPPKQQTGSAASTTSAGGAGEETSAPSQPTTSRQAGLPAVFAAAWGPAAEGASSAAQQGSTVAAVIDLNLVRGMAAPSESAASAKPPAEAAVAETVVAETAGEETTDGGAPVLASALGESVRAASAGPEHTATPDELDTDADQVTQTSHPAVPAAQIRPDGQVVVSDAPVGEEPASHKGENVASNETAQPDQTQAEAPAVRGDKGDVSAQPLAHREREPGTPTLQAAAAGSAQADQKSTNEPNVGVHRRAATSTSAQQVPLQQAQEGTAVRTPVHTGNAPGAGHTSPEENGPVMHPSDVTVSKNQSPGAGGAAGVTAETPLAPTTSSTTPTTAASAAAPTAQAAGVQPTAAPAPTAQPAAPAAAPLQAQLAGPIAQLATGPAGEKILTVNVAPENLGPVTVRANISGETLRIELFAPQDAGREALRGMLTDLRRELAGLGLGSSQVSLGEGDAPSSSSGQPRGDAQLGERSRDPAAGHPPAEDSGPRDRQRAPSAEQVLDQLSGAPAVSRLVGSVLLSEPPHPVGLDLLA